MSRRTRFIDRLTQPAGTLPALVWAACILLILALTVIGFPKGALSTDILDLLPSSSADVRTGELAQAATRGIADRVIWAVREDASNPGAADEFVRSLWERELVTSLSGRMDEADRRIWLEAMRRDVLGLLDEKTVSGLLGDKAKGHLRWMLGQLYSPVAGVTGDEWRADPWLLLRSVMMSQGRGMPTLDDGWITAKDSDGRSWRLLTGRVPVSALSGDGLKAWIAAEADIRRAVLSERPDAAIAGQGVLYYSHHAASQAERDMKPNELPRHTLTARVDWASGPFTAYVKSSSKFDMAVSNPGNKGSRNAPKYEDYTIVDIGGSWTPVKNHVIAWAVNNVLDKDTAVFEKSGTSSWANIYSNYIEGRNLWLSYTYSF